MNFDPNLSELHKLLIAPIQRRRNRFIALLDGGRRTERGGFPLASTGRIHIRFDDRVLPTYRQLKENPNKAQALRQAMLANLKK